MIVKDEDYKRIKGQKNIYIYGAKNIANFVYDRLAEERCDVKGFIVSRTVNNPDFVKGLPVRLVYDMLPEKEQVYVIVAVLPNFRKEVVELLMQLGFCNLITMDDEYVWALKRSFDKIAQEKERVKERVNYLDSVGYLLDVPEEIEQAHAIVQKKESPQSIKWRIDMRRFEYTRQAVAAGAWKNDRLTVEYEQIFGKAAHMLWHAERPDDSANDSKIQAADITGLVNLYAVRCHVDKPVKGHSPYTYIKEIQAGAALTEQRLCDLVDNTGGNISDRNRDFSECTAIYWIWKNGPKKEYTGVCHYRRYLDISPTELKNQLEQGTTLIHTVPCLMYPSIKSFFIDWFLYEYDWLLMMKLIKKTRPEYYETAREFENGHFYLANNIFIMKTEWFDRMCDFIFGILLEIDRLYAERKFERQDRYAGFLFEVLYSIFVMHHAKEMRIAYADMLYIG